MQEDEFCGHVVRVCIGKKKEMRKLFRGRNFKEWEHTEMCFKEMGWERVDRINLGV
jgi:hypothetical protein